MAQSLEEKYNTEIKDGKQYCMDNPNGICLAVAGPGTGKTYAISRRIRTIIKNGYSSDRILCLTFTDTASEQMKKGIKEALIEENLDTSNLNVNVCTFHSFCMNIVKNYSGIFELMDGVKVIPDSVSRMFVKNITDEIMSDVLITETGSRLQYIDAILNGIKEIKKYNYNENDFFKNLENFENEKDKLKAADLWKFYVKYEKMKLENNYIDFSDMIIMVVKKFKSDKEFLKTIANTYDYILIDEYQDTNPLQNEIIYQLGEFCQNIFAVGDDDQTIFAFQGAKITTMKEYINHFEKNGKPVQVVTFNDNRRSTKNIIDVSRSIVLIQRDYGRYIKEKLSIRSKGINKNEIKEADEYSPVFIPLEWDEKFKKYKLNKELNAVNDKLTNNPVYCIEYEDEEAERYSIIEKIKELKKTTPLNEIAVLTRGNNDLVEYAKLLKKNNIDYELKNGKNIFEINSVDILISYLGLLVDPDVYSGRFLRYMLSPVFHINPDDYTTLYKNRAHSNIIKSMEDILEGKLEKKEFIDKEKIKDFLKIYNGLKGSSDGLADFKEGANLEETILLAMNETGILDYYTNKIETGRVENLLGLKKFVEEARGYQEIHKNLKTTNNLAGFIEYIEQMSNDDVKIFADKPDYKYDAVQLSTLHSSKGNEYRYVFMPSLNKSKWESRAGGGGIKINVPFEKDRELELKTEQYINDNKPKYVIDWLNGEAKIMEQIKLMFVGITRAKEGLYLSYTDSNNNASTFLRILKEDFENRKSQFNFIDENKTINTEEENIEILYNKLSCQRYDYKKDFSELINTTIDNINHFYPTRLNDLTKCRRRFLYEDVMGLGSDETQGSADYGTAVHNTLEIITDYMIDKKALPSLDEIKSIFKEEMSKLNFLPENKNDFTSKGETTLDKYYETIKSWDMKNLYKAEMKIKEFEIEGEKFTVKIDRVDKDPDNGYVIYDYKTGSVKKDKEVTFDGEASDYFNQLAFYKYILHKKEGVELDRIKTALLFTKNSSTLNVPINEEDCIKVKNKYFDTIKKLREADFEKAPEDDKEKACKYCSCKKFCEWGIFKEEK